MEVEPEPPQVPQSLPEGLLTALIRPPLQRVASVPCALDPGDAVVSSRAAPTCSSTKSHPEQPIPILPIALLAPLRSGSPEPCRKLDTVLPNLWLPYRGGDFSTLEPDLDMRREWFPHLDALAASP